MLNVPAPTLRFRSRYPAVARSVRAIRTDVLDTARDCGADGECLEEIRLAVSEAAREAVARSLSAQIEGAGPLSSARWSVVSSLDAAGFRPARTMAESLGAVLDYYSE